MQKKVLLADDEARILGLVQATLGGDDRYEVFLAADGEEALNLCLEHRPDLVFLDLLMPKMDGYAVCRHLKESPETRGIKIVMLTAMAQETDRLTAMNAGADDYMTKPFSPGALLEKIEELMSEPKAA